MRLPPERFPDVGDHTNAPFRPIRTEMDAASLILSHCFAFELAEHREPVRARLEAELGHRFASQLVAALTKHSRVG